MNRKALRILEYDKITALLEKHATCDPGRRLCRELLPYKDFEEARGALGETACACDMLREKGNTGFGDVRPLGDSLRRLEIGSCLGMAELYAVGKLLGNVSRVKQWARSDTENLLSKYFTGLEPASSLYKDITSCIDSEETMLDDASPALKKIRRQYKNITDRMHSELNIIMNSYRDLLMDPVVAVRDGAYCLPVRIENRTKVPGVIHDQSSSGSTVFIEPMAVIKLNNDIRELEAEDKAEVARILEELTAKAQPWAMAVKTDLEIMAHLDFVFAKAKLSGEMKAETPELNRDHVIDLRNARHPLIQGKKVVPIDIRLGEDYDLLIITGPNTGGKTVSLKTVGLLTLMAQAGLNIPAFGTGTVAFFDQVFADIGDEQSIEQSLSTFSGHMKNIVEIIEKADGDSLCLFDELGAGTDPTEGAALAISILSFLHRMQVRTIATTHYSELKVFALETPGVENASCEFDINTLRPTYRIITGIPGRSNAFAISRKLGLPDHIIEEAGEHIEKNDAAFEDLIAKLNEDRAVIERERLEIEANRKEIERLKKQRESREEDLDARKERIIREAKEEARKILADAKETADDTIKRITKLSSDSGLNRALENERKRLREGLKKNEEQVSEEENLDALTRLQRAWNGGGTDTRKKGEPQRHTVHMKSALISPEINLIGQNVDEACAQLEKYLDDAILAHMNSVRIIHGRGTGALRKGIHAFLRKQPYVKNYHVADFKEGGEAVTIVEF